jgi:2-oxoglutarate dehydrogenase E1 component
MMPKSLLRLDRAASSLADLTKGHFESVLNDPVGSDPEHREEVTRLVLCSGKIFYDLTEVVRPAHVAIARVEQLYPWPHASVDWLLDFYPGIDEVVWAQEEPKNMGAWTFVAPRLRAAAGNTLPVTYVGRPERASPAEGYQASHQREQKRIVTEVLEGKPRPGTRRINAAGEGGRANPAESTPSRTRVQGS